MSVFVSRSGVGSFSFSVIQKPLRRQAGAVRDIISNDTTTILSLLNYSQVISTPLSLRCLIIEDKDKDEPDTST